LRYVNTRRFVKTGKAKDKCDIVVRVISAGPFKLPERTPTAWRGSKRRGVIVLGKLGL
jgi:hypothetical protein